MKRRDSMFSSFTLSADTPKEKKLPLREADDAFIYSFKADYKRKTQPTLVLKTPDTLDNISESLNISPTLKKRKKTFKNMLLYESYETIQSKINEPLLEIFD